MVYTQTKARNQVLVIQAELYGQMKNEISKTRC